MIFYVPIRFVNFRCILFETIQRPAETIIFQAADFGRPGKLDESQARR